SATRRARDTHTNAVRSSRASRRAQAALPRSVPARCARRAAWHAACPSIDRIRVRAAAAKAPDAMADIWIVHRDPRWRDALRGLAGSNEVLVGHPSDAGRFARADAPRAVLLGVAGDFE